MLEEKFTKVEQGHIFVFKAGKSISFICIAQQETQRDKTTQIH